MELVSGKDPEQNIPLEITVIEEVLAIEKEGKTEFLR